MYNGDLFHLTLEFNYSAHDARVHNLPVRKTPNSNPHHSKHSISMPDMEIRANVPQPCRLSELQPATKTNVKSSDIT